MEVNTSRSLAQLKARVNRERKKPNSQKKREKKKRKKRGWWGKDPVYTVGGSVCFTPGKEGRRGRGKKNVNVAENFQLKPEKRLLWNKQRKTGGPIIIGKRGRGEKRERKLSIGRCQNHERPRFYGLLLVCWESLLDSLSCPTSQCRVGQEAGGRVNKAKTMLCWGTLDRRGRGNKKIVGTRRGLRVTPFQLLRRKGNGKGGTKQLPISELLGGMGKKSRTPFYTNNYTAKK